MLTLYLILSLDSLSTCKPNLLPLPTGRKMCGRTGPWCLSLNRGLEKTTFCLFRLGPTLRALVPGSGLDQLVGRKAIKRIRGGGI